MSVLAVTGATGFVGKRFVALAVERGHHVRALTRRPQPEQAGVTWVAGSLGDPMEQLELMRGADAVVHIAGVVNAPSARAFEMGNVIGTMSMLDSAIGAGVRRFVHVSSLAAREPELSLYGGSKASAEQAVMRSDLNWDMVRPPGVYGPGDLDQLELFKMARLGLAFLPPPGRLSLIHADDLAALLLALATAPATGAVYEADDGQPGGYSYAEFARAIGMAVGRRVLPMSLPPALLRLGAAIDRRVRGDKARLTRDRVNYFCHPDWTISPDKRPPGTLWRPQIATADGLRQTAQWYRANGLL
ncbi:NAD-dependent epimerase/dehydratase family protein [Sphingomonas aracearum]|uniref:NAD-dependent epimerase/dehydratase family protein n=1 Tax=Sphingomonas aracearum TaxID=2283317 RepID=A0A369W008_9SPHN|nr:NAD(P)H-binding protein [Sphingomonas aracearum]RDE06642.1 NAD-dependent epimerase/dehydratase family protein [Sphingomonas aracearum]